MQRAAAMASVPHPTGVRPWQVAPAAPAAFLALLPDIHPVAAQVLYNRGLTSAAEVRLFLDGGAAPLHDPRTLYSIERAVVRLRRAVRDGERVAVYGDFDVDGVTATAILLLGLRVAGAQVTPVVPQRTTTGYGLRPETVERLAAEGVRLIVTGDTGTRATEAVTRAAELGVDVIVTDHHLPGEELPPALAVVNPQQVACPYPFKELSGAGVAWKLVQALALEGCLPMAVAESLLDLVALGTIVDVAPLRGENRALVQRGLRRLEESPRLGIRAMLGLLGQESRQGQGPPAGMSSRRRAIDERTVAFNIGPRLNAAGRMDDPALALELLLTEDEARALQLVRQLEVQHQERQRLTEVVLAEAREQAAALPPLPLLVLRGQSWPGGVIGLVASRIAEEFGRPAFVVDVGEEACRGSGRSAGGFDLVGILSDCAELLLEFGGHSQAAGFAVRRERLETLVERLYDVATRRPPEPPPPLQADYALAEEQLDWALYHALLPLRPYGHGNPAPLFFTPRLSLLDVKPVGAGGKHLRARLRFQKQVIHAFGPDLGAQATELAVAGRMDAVYTLEASTWNGFDSLELRLEAVRPALTEAAPQRSFAVAGS